jgi:hypothetical protein
MRLLIVVTGNSATGTITVTGKDFTQAQNAATETTPTIAVSGTASNPNPTGYEYVTSAIFSTVNASGVTVSGLTGGSVKIYGIQAARFLLPAMLDAEEKFPMYSPQEQRGIMVRDTAIQQLIKQVDIAKLEQTFYPDNCLWLPYMLTGSAPTTANIATSVSSVLSLKVATATSGPFSLTTQPNTLGPGMLLRFTVASSSAVGTITVAGTNVYGQSITETILAGVPGAANGNGTYYSQQVFASVSSNGVSFTGLTSGTCAVDGFFAESYTFTGDSTSNTVYSSVLEWYTGTDAITYPFFFLTDVSIEGGTEKETKITGKGMAQDSLAIGNRTTTPLTASTASVPIGTIGAFSNLWQPFDIGLAGWQTAWYIDALSGTAGTTSYPVVLDWKLDFKIPQKPSYPAVNWQRFQKVYRQQRETTMDLTIDFADELQYEQFRQNFNRQLVQVQFIGPYVGSTTSPVAAVYKQWTFTFHMRWTSIKRDTSGMEKVTAKISGRAEYSTALGYDYTIKVVNQIPPTYNG